MKSTDDRPAAKKSGVRASGRGPARLGTDEHLSRADRVARGKDARAVAPLEAHAQFEPGASRDPVGLLLGQAQSRVPELVPIRHGRMLVSPFTFYRGAALPMAADLATTPDVGAAGAAVRGRAPVQLRRVRLAGAAAGLRRQRLRRDPARPVRVGRQAAGGEPGRRRDATTGSPPRSAARSSSPAVEGYRTAMREFAEQPLLGRLVRPPRRRGRPSSQFRSQLKAKRVQGDREDAGQGPHPRQHAGAEQADHHGRRAAPDHQRPAADRAGRGAVHRRAGRRASMRSSTRLLGEYRRTLQSDRRHLLEQFTLVQVARKVVGVGSVGTRAWILLLEAGDGSEPLFLQAKEAQAVGAGRLLRAQRVRPTRASGWSPGST